ncbi:helix-turn-helix domain-containing protein [Streptococcus hyovaginalis]|uniref:helix-turn-helix domain-containing protein n=1 Tax=Streptococcus hyovaginalis TaxID=149015 RepID=UPI001BB1D418|nr:helix-turn-helix transcriptional regulator [Streptococcus hyovaginalis]
MMLRLKELRKEKGITLKELSQTLKERYNLIVSDGQLSNYENEKRRPRDETIWNDIADYFGVWVPYLLGNSKIRTEEQAEKLAENISELNSSLANRSWEHKLGTIDELENQLLFYFRELPDTYKKFALKSVENIFILKEENDDKGGK